MNKDKTPKDDFEKEFFKLTNKAVLVKTMDNERKDRLVTIEATTKFLFSERNYHMKIFCR